MDFPIIGPYADEAQRQRITQQAEEECRVITVIQEE